MLFGIVLNIRRLLFSKTLSRNNLSFYTMDSIFFSFEGIKVCSLPSIFRICGTDSFYDYQLALNFNLRLYGNLVNTLKTCLQYFYFQRRNRLCLHREKWQLSYASAHSSMFIRYNIDTLLSIIHPPLPLNQALQHFRKHFLGNEAQKRNVVVKSWTNERVNGWRYLYLCMK